MNILYEEKLSSTRTQLLFLTLAIIFGLLSFWRIKVNSFDWAAKVPLGTALFFIFYVLNYRTLVIHIEENKVRLQFGIFSWTVPFKNIASCELDDNIPPFLKYGGAGIHFMTVHERYRVSFNFLEHERVVIRLKEKQGLAKDISFSTQNPDEIIKLFR